MENNTHHQCSLCLNLNNQLSSQSRQHSYVSSDINGLYLPKPIVIYHDLVSNMNSYFNYLHLINKSAMDRNDYSNRFIQVINRDDDLIRSQIPRHNHSQLMDDTHSNKAGVLLCTCNEFINHTLQRRENNHPYSSLLSKSLHLQQIPASNYFPINTNYINDQSNSSNTQFASTSSTSNVSSANVAPITDRTIAKHSLMYSQPPFPITANTNKINSTSHPAFNQSQPIFPAQYPIKINHQSNTRSYSIGPIPTTLVNNTGENATLANSYSTPSYNHNSNIQQHTHKSTPCSNTTSNNRNEHDIDFGSIKSFTKTLDESSITSEFHNSVYSTTSIASEPMCRFCHLSKQTVADPLISPCLCSGTLKLVHQNCLKTWLDVSKKQRESRNAPDKSPHCELCNFKYVRKRRFQCGSLKYPKLSQNDCALHLIFLCSLLVMLTSASVTILCFAMEKSSTSFFNPNIRDKFVFSNLHRKSTIKKQKIENYKVKTLQYLIKCQKQLQNSTNSRNKTDCDLHKSSPPKKPAPTYQNYPKQTLRNNAHSSKFAPPQRSPSSSRLWILSPEEAVTLASGVIFFIAFFIAMVVQVKSSYTCYQLILQWIRLNYIYEVQPLRPVTPPPSPPASRKGSVRLPLTSHKSSNRKSRRHIFSHQTGTQKQREHVAASSSLTKCCIFTPTDDFTDTIDRDNTLIHNTNLPSSPSVVVVSSQSSSSSLTHNLHHIHTLQRPREYIERCVTEI